jgi:hypothetical protein
LEEEMKTRIVFFFSLLFILTLFSSAWALVFEENFDYTAGTPLTANGWSSHSGAGSGPVIVAEDNLTYPGYPSSSGNCATTVSGGAEDVNRTFAVQSAGSVYVSTLMRMSSFPNTSTDYIFHIGPSPIGSTYKARLFVQRDASNNVRFGLSKSSTTVVYTDYVYSLDTTYLIVIKYVIVDGTVNDEVYAWINPVINGVEPAPTITASDFSQSDINVGSVAIRQSANTPITKFDGIRVANSWLELLPYGTIAAPTIQASDIVFSNIQQTQMDVSWTNGDGMNRIVVMNTTNSFTDPVDGTDPAANPVYAGSGEQVVYNGSGSTVSVTGLSPGTTYWFRAFEFNGAATETVYLTTTATDNPNNQSTQAPAPLLLVSPVSLSGFNYLVGNGPSASQTFTVSGINLTDNIVVTGTADYEISLDGLVYSSPITLVPAGGSVAETTIYVHLAAGLAVGEYNNEDITVASAGADGFVVTCNGAVYGQPANLFFSEYLEGSSNNKAIEIYNASGSAVDLSDYKVELYSNGASTPGNTLVMSGTLAAGDVYIIANASANASILALADATSGVTFFNGDDALALRYIGPNLLLDVFGTIGFDPGTGWNVAGVTNATVDHTLVRKNTVTQGNTDWASQAGTDANNSEWVVYPIDYLDNLGFHAYGVVNEPPVISNIVLDPESDYTSSTTVAVYADVTDADGTVADVELRWGTETGVYPNTIAMVFASGNTYSTISDIPAQPNGTTVYFVVYAEDDDADFAVTAEQSYMVIDPATPVLTVAPLALTGFTYIYNNGPSANQSFTVSGIDLTADVVIEAPLHYEISLDASTWTSPINLAPTAGAVAETTVYVRLIAGLAVGTYNLEDITVNSTGAVGYNVTCSGSVTAPPPFSIAELRPVQVDISTATSESAVLMHIGNYPTDDVKYRLYNGSFQYNCWNPVTETYITSSIYAEGPSVPGTPTSSTTWWIPYQRGGNNSTAASYRDRLGPTYGANYRTQALPAATAIVTAETISKNHVNFVTWNSFDDKYVVLGYDAETGGTLISATSTALGSGNFSLLVESGTVINRIEVRDLLNNLIESVTGTWPVLSVDAPVFDPVAGTYFSAQNVSITSGTPDAVIYYSIVGDTGPWTEYTGSLNVASSTTIWAYAVKAGMEDSPVVSAAYVLPIDVATIAELRMGAVGGTLYHLTGEAVLTFQQATRHQKYIQDATAAILIDDMAGIITTPYNLYDGITGIYGTLTTYGGLLQFVPVANTAPASSEGNVVIPEVRTLASLTSADQAKLVKIMVAQIDNTSGNFLATAQNLNVTDASGTITLRTFPATDYSGTPIPGYPVNITCLVGEYNTAMQISPRFLADIVSAGTYIFGGTENVYELPIPVGAPAMTVNSIAITPDNPSGFEPISITQTWTNTGIPGEAYVRLVYNVNCADNSYLVGDYVLHHVGLGYTPGAAGYIWNGSVYQFDAAEVSFSADQTSFSILILPEGAKGELVILLGSEQPTLPVELSGFYAVVTAQNYVSLTWITQSETSLSGYYVFRNDVESLATAVSLNSAGIISAMNTSNETSYVFIDQEVQSGSTYYYWLQCMELDGTSRFFGPITATLSNTNPDTPPAIPTVTDLLNAFPNPFNPMTTIPYSIKEAAQVRIDVYNIRGQLIRSFAQDHSSAGYYKVVWDGKDTNGTLVSSGIYYYRMTSGKFTSSKKVILMK